MQKCVLPTGARYLIKPLFVALLVAVLASLLFPGRAMACESFIFGQLFCFSDRVEERANRDIQLEQIQLQAATQAQAGQAQIELLRQQGSITEQQAYQMGESLRKSIDAQMQVNLAQYQMASQALQNQTEIATAGIAEAGKTERLGMAIAKLAELAVLLALVLMAVKFMSSRKQTHYLGKPTTQAVRAIEDSVAMPVVSRHDLTSIMRYRE